jgi:hypothetical protein
LTSAIDGSEWSASRPGRFIPREGATGIHRIEGWVRLRAGLGTVSKKKNSQQPPGFEPRSSYRPARSESLYRLRNPGSFLLSRYCGILRRLCNEYESS